MTTPTSAHSHSVGNAVTSVTPVNLFALLFEILIFILIVLSIVAAVRRYFGARIGTQAPVQAGLVDDIEAQTGQGNTSVKNSSGSRWLSSLRGPFLSSSRDDCLSDTTALLEKDISKSLLLPVSSARSSSSGFSFLHKLLGRFRSLPPTGVKSDAQAGSTDSPDRVRSHMRALRDQLTREWVNTIPGVGGSHHRFPRGTVKPKLASIEIPTIIVTSPEDITTSESPEAEAYSPVTTYSEPDSPAIATPRLDSSVDLDVRVVGGEVDQLQIPFPSWGPASDEEETVNLSNFSSELFQLGAPPSRKTTTTPALDSATPQLDFSSVESYEDTYPHLLFAIAEEEEPEELQPPTIGTITPQLDSAGLIPATEASVPQSSSTPSPSLQDVHSDVSLAIAEEETESPRIFDACGRLDLAPVYEFLHKDPAIVTSDVHGSTGEAPSDDDEEDWEKAFCLGGRLTRAFSSPLSNDSLGDDDYDDDEYELPEEAYEVLHKTTSACEVQVHGAHKHKHISSLSATIEWCDTAFSEASSSEASSDAGSDYQDASSDDESNSSFYSCSGSSATEDDTAVDNSFSSPKVHCARPSAFSILEGYFLPQCDAVA
ncbi:hypothetical protein TRAPUB_14256 [Trametes pubescens]|uniref:Uncharacterized protein n=1 Tax=Trametes pubescens TaxID=154538 RepID=A0A1M2VNS7_TRAPU|nr:hypothetical protein TRAPUB_14256 [Trametes pubescens]